MQLHQRPAEARDAGQGAAQIVGDRKAEGLQLAIDLVELIELALQMFIERLDLLFRVPAALNGVLQLRVAPFEERRLVLEEQRFAMQLDEDADLGAQDLRQE